MPTVNIVHDTSGSFTMHNSHIANIRIGLKMFGYLRRQ